MTVRPHGYTRYKLDNCRCYVCGYAVAQYNDRRNAMITAGTWRPYTDPQPAREHVKHLTATGMGYARIARVAGVASSTVGNLLYADPPRTRIRTSAALAILAISPVTDAANAPGRARLPAIGTRRRVQALTTIGYSLSRQAGTVGWTIANFTGLANGRRDLVTAATARRITAVYDDWSMIAPPDTAETRRVRRFATKRLWLPPLAWDDETIDDPAGAPCVLPPVEGSDPAVDELAVSTAYIYHDHAIPSDVVDELIRRLTVGGYTAAQIAPVARVSNAWRVQEARTRLHLTTTYSGASSAPVAQQANNPHQGASE